MKRTLNKIFSSPFISRNRRALVILADICIYILISAAVYLYLILSHDMSCEFNIFAFNVMMFGIFCFILHLSVGNQKKLWRYAGAREYLDIFLSDVIAFIIYLLVMRVFLWTKSSPFAMAAVASCSLVAKLVMRFVYRIYRQSFSGTTADPNEKTHEKRVVAIVGAGNAGVTLVEELRRNENSPYDIWGLIDDDTEKIGKNIQGIDVKCSISDMAENIKNSNVQEVILAIPSLPVERRREIALICAELRCKLRILPDTLMAMENANFSASVRDVQVEDLLGRTVIKLDQNVTGQFVTGKTIVVTGGGGSIGSELCRQLASHNPKKLIIFDIFENNAYDLKNELLRLLKNSDVEVEIEIGSVRDKERIEQLFEKYHPDIVFHAAAHKHVPLMEHNPAEAVKNNIFGTYNFMSTALKYRCPKFVMISTDKAVNPTSVMGATKRYCEYMTFALAKRPDCHTEFVSVRFGNVLASSGSVIPLFQRQIELGGPVTITDKRMTRYFMTIPEAASLVLTASAMAHQTEIYVLHMGKAMKILDLAENLIRLSGFEPYKDIEIKEIGMRPGEKLYEEPLIDEDIHFKTANDKIYVEKQPDDSEVRDIDADFAVLNDALRTGKDEEVVKALKKVVPDFDRDNARNSEPETFYHQN